MCAVNGFMARVCVWCMVREYTMGEQTFNSLNIWFTAVTVSSSSGSAVFWCMGI